MDTYQANASDPFLICYSPTMITTNGIWAGDNPLDYALPLFVLQMTLVVVITRVFYFLLKPLHQPRFIAEVIGGVILGPSVLGRVPNFVNLIFPTRSISVLETMASLGLLYSIFLVGLQMDVRNMNCMGRRAWGLAGSGVALPFLIEMLAFITFGGKIREKTYNDAYLLFLGVSLSITAFNVLGRILAELKLLNTETGRLSMSAAVLSCSLAWMLLAVAIALTGRHRNGVSSIAVIGSGVALLALTYATVRPIARWIVSHTREGEPIHDHYLSFILLLVMVGGLVADVVGIHAVFGAFAVGAAIPDGPLVSALTEKLEDFVNGLLLPLYFASNGSQVKLTSMKDFGISGFLAFVIFFAAIARVGATMIVSTMFYGIPPREGLLLGILMNTKGMMELVVLRIALDKKVLYTQSYSMMVLMSAVMTALVTPLSNLALNPTRRKNLVHYKRRTIQKLKSDVEFRVLACVHTIKNVPSVLNLVQISNPTKNSPIFVCALQLTELTGRASAMLVVHDAHRSLGSTGKSQRQNAAANMNRWQAQTEQIKSMLETHEQHFPGVSLHSMAIASAYSTMHEDVMHIAEDKQSALIILPFHKHQTVDGGLELTNHGIRTLNQNIMANPPCSVALLVDRGLGGVARMSAGTRKHNTNHIAVIFFGGPDDREALSYASRMAEQPHVNLTVLCLLDANQASPNGPEPSLKDPRLPNIMTNRQRQRLLDDACIKEFRLRFAGDESVVYVEKAVSNGEETMSVVRSVDGVHDLYIVGRGDGVHNPLTVGLMDWSECAELGAIGDLLASSDFSATVSVLVVQQYKEDMTTGMEPDSPENTTNHFPAYVDNSRDKINCWAS